MRFEGTVTRWDDVRGFGYIESTQGGEPIFAHVSAWTRGAARPTIDQRVTFSVEPGDRGKRAVDVQPLPSRRRRAAVRADHPARWGTATLFAIPAFVLLYAAIALLWRPPAWLPGLYVGASVLAFLAYAADKRSATQGAPRVPERTLHGLALAGGWPGALLAQQLLRHKTAKRPFRRVFWVTVALNVVGLLALVTPLRGLVVAAA